MYLVWINPPINFTFSDDSVFLKKNLGGGLKFSEFACLLYDPLASAIRYITLAHPLDKSMRPKIAYVIAKTS